MVQVCCICEELVAGAAATVEVQGQEEAGGRGEMRAGEEETRRRQEARREQLEDVQMSCRYSSVLLQRGRSRICRSSAFSDERWRAGDRDDGEVVDCDRSEQKPREPGDITEQIRCTRAAR